MFSDLVSVTISSQFYPVAMTSQRRVPEAAHDLTLCSLKRTGRQNIPILQTKKNKKISRLSLLFGHKGDICNACVRDAIFQMSVQAV